MLLLVRRVFPVSLCSLFQPGKAPQILHAVSGWLLLTEPLVTCGQSAGDMMPERSKPHQIMLLSP